MRTHAKNWYKSSSINCWVSGQWIGMYCWLSLLMFLELLNPGVGQTAGVHSPPPDSCWLRYTQTQEWVNPWWVYPLSLGVGGQPGCIPHPLTLVDYPLTSPSISFESCMQSLFVWSCTARHREVRTFCILWLGNQANPSRYGLLSRAWNFEVSPLPCMPEYISPRTRPDVWCKCPSCCSWLESQVNATPSIGRHKLRWRQSKGLCFLSVASELNIGSVEAFSGNVDKVCTWLLSSFRCLYDNSPSPLPWRHFFFQAKILAIVLLDSIKKGHCQIQFIIEHALSARLARQTTFDWIE